MGSRAICAAWSMTSTGPTDDSSAKLLVVNTQREEVVRRVAPEGLRWATGGGTVIGGCNGVHLAKADISGTLCGLYGPATTIGPQPGYVICGNCARIAKVPRS